MKPHGCGLTSAGGCNGKANWHHESYWELKNTMSFTWHSPDHTFDASMSSNDAQISSSLHDISYWISTSWRRNFNITCRLQYTAFSIYLSCLTWSTILALCLPSPIPRAASRAVNRNWGRRIPLILEELNVRAGCSVFLRFPRYQIYPFLPHSNLPSLGIAHLVSVLCGMHRLVPLSWVSISIFQWRCQRNLNLLSSPGWFGMKHTNTLVSIWFPDSYSASSVALISLCHECFYKCALIHFSLPTHAHIYL